MYSGWKKRKKSADLNDIALNEWRVTRPDGSVSVVNGKIYRCRQVQIVHFKEIPLLY
jgi:hypothetical protein